MKEATGELNMTVITVVAIAAVGAFFYAFVWPNIQSTIERNTKCANATCKGGDGEFMDCTYFDADQNDYVDIKCPITDTTDGK